MLTMYLFWGWCHFSKVSKSFEKIAKNVVLSVVERNDHLPPTKIVEITSMAGCSALKKK